MLKLKYYVLFESNREKIKCMLDIITSNYELICVLFSGNCTLLLLFTIVFCYKYLNIRKSNSRKNSIQFFF